jgi:hypothetical protein
MEARLDPPVRRGDSPDGGFEAGITVGVDVNPADPASSVTSAS